MYTVKKLDVGSVFRVTAMIVAVLWLVIGLPFVLMFSSVSLLINDVIGQGFNEPEIASLSGLGVVGGLIFYVCGVFVYAITGGIIGAIYALVYNLIVRWTGGIKLQLDAPDQLYPEKAKRQMRDELNFD
ncbi:hypothetical protein MASR2M15_08660 [Anaerolineales bacterium]